MIENTVAMWKNKGNRIVFTNGCFDLIHVGHVELFEYAKSLGDKLIVGMNSDKSVAKLKGRGRPVLNEVCRYGVLISIRYVDYVSIFDDTTPEELIKRIRPDFLVKGEDYIDKPVAGGDFVVSTGGKVVYYPFKSKQSTSNLIDRIKRTSTNEFTRSYV